MSQLFRQEVIRAKQARWLGHIVLIRPVSFSLLTGLAVLLGLSVLLFLCFGQYTKRAQVAGILAPDAGLIKVSAAQSGRILERRIVEGQQVKAGDVLFVLSSEQEMLSGQTSATQTAQPVNEAILTQLRERQASLMYERREQKKQTEQQREWLTKRLQSMQVEVQKIQQQVDTQGRRLASAQGQLARYRELSEQKFASESALQQKQDEFLDQQGRLQALELALLQIQREQASVQSDLVQLDSKSSREQEQLSRAVSELGQSGLASQSQQRWVITAPSDGLVTAINADPGQLVGPQALLTLLPSHAQLQAQLFAPSRAAGFVEAGQQVRIRYAAYPYQKFGQYDGVVLNVSRSALPAAELPASLANLGQQGTGEGLYRITVKLAAQQVTAYGKPVALSDGMQLQADILQDSRRLIEWVLEPLTTLRGKL
ncbi:HlyD family secretion protein [Roseateles chitinivorans]|uniref:HlyD family secretion protein n=1 Tax=Roseateles chitinivorans TaxID=2917965 RepID=UPI003D66F978